MPKKSKVVCKKKGRAYTCKVTRGIAKGRTFTLRTSKKR
jgi:hypothetical protein